jgi:methionyl-tRNA formyltransferase
VVIRVTPGLRLVFFGTPDFAVPTLQAMLDSRHAVAGVVTQPDRPRGRGQQVVASPVKQRAVTAGLPVLQPDRLKDEGFLQAFSAWEADLGVVAAYGRILPAAVLAAPRLGLINVHASLLPRHRGAAPVHRAVIAGDATTGVSIMRVVQALDAGPVFATVSRRIGPDDTSAQVERDLAMLGAGLAVEVIDALADGRAVSEPQDEAGVTYAHRLEKAEGALDWARPAAEIHNRVRGLQPWPMAWTFLHGRRVIVVQSRLVPEAVETDAAPGTVLHVTRDGLRVRTAGGAIDLVVVQPEGRRPMSARDYAAGHRLTPGDVFAPGMPAEG